MNLQLTLLVKLISHSFVKVQKQNAKYKNREHVQNVSEASRKLKQLYF